MVICPQQSKAALPPYKIQQIRLTLHQIDQFAYISTFVAVFTCKSVAVFTSKLRTGQKRKHIMNIE